jgi:hypothetical protein
MAHAKKHFVSCRGFVATLSPLKLGLLALAFACGLMAGTHKKKQSDLAPNLIGDTTATANGTQLRFAGIPGFAYTIQTSSDGTNWTAIASIVAPANGLMKYLDSNSPDASQFYRTIAP